VSAGVMAVRPQHRGQTRLALRRWAQSPAIGCTGTWPPRWPPAGWLGTHHSWSSGQTRRQLHGLKLINRQASGRAELDTARPSNSRHQSNPLVSGTSDEISGW